MDRNVKTSANESSPPQQQAAGRAQRKTSRTWAALLVIGYSAFVLSGLWLLIFGVSCAFVHSDIPSFGLDASAIRLTGAPGKPIAFWLTGTSVFGYWASVNGVALHLRGSDGDVKTFTITPPVSQNWGTEIWCTEGGNGSGCDDDLSLPLVQFTVPSYTGGTELTGSVTGDVQSPQNAPGGYYTIDDQQLNIPVTLIAGGAAMRINPGYYLFGVNPVTVWAFFGSSIFYLFLWGAVQSGKGGGRPSLASAATPTPASRRTARSPRTGTVTSMNCPGCQFRQRKPDNAEKMNCAHCGKEIIFLTCSHTKKACAVLSEWTNWSAPGCEFQHSGPTVICPGCQLQQRKPDNAEKMNCAHCGKEIIFLVCLQTKKACPVLSEWAAWTHPGCELQHPAGR